MVKGKVPFTDEPRGPFGSRPTVGQSKPYVSGSNAHGVHQRRTVGPEPGAKGVARADGPDRAGTGTIRDLKGPPRAPK